MSDQYPKNQHNKDKRPNKNILFSNEAIPTTSSLLYYVSVVGPSVLIGFFILLSIFNQNLKGLAYLVGICVLFTLTSTFNEMFSALSENNGSEKCYSHGLLSSSGGLSYGTLVYVFSFFYLLLPMMINGIVNIPLLFSLIMVMIVDGVVNIRQGCTTMTFIVVSFLLAMIAGTFWSLIIYQIKPDLVYHTDYITNNKLACSMPSKQKFKCVVKKRGEIIG
uniref:Uncharacterized protein n=1 Tax=viral metagenome TaxID=1070528 RepID=A0A6C0L1X4_9ZZZZ|tara:strand:+ start:4475 stop:5134 length:660 start_codon:yes stop_codon:yes gene_type:complete